MTGVQSDVGLPTPMTELSTPSVNPFSYLASNLRSLRHNGSPVVGIGPGTAAGSTAIITANASRSLSPDLKLLPTSPIPQATQRAYPPGMAFLELAFLIYHLNQSVG